MKLSLAGWSLQKRFRAPQNPLQLIDFPAYARDTFGITAVELNNIFFASRDYAYVRSLVAAAQNAGVALLNIAVDEKGDLSADDANVRAEGLYNYRAWIPVAAAMGIRAIRCNSGGRAITDRARAVAHCTESFKQLADDGRRHNVTILMENHWGLSSDPESMIAVIAAVRKSHGPEAAGTMPDFGNWPPETERFAAMAKVFPYAGAVHAKVLDIDENLNHPAFDLAQCVTVARAAGYDGYLGIEYEGAGDPVEGVKRAVQKLAPLM